MFCFAFIAILHFHYFLPSTLYTLLDRPLLLLPLNSRSLHFGFLFCCEIIDKFNVFETHRPRKKSSSQRNKANFFVDKARSVFYSSFIIISTFTVILPLMSIYPTFPHHAFLDILLVYRQSGSIPGISSTELVSQPFLYRNGDAKSINNVSVQLCTH